MKKIKVLNLYAGIGGNRKLWENVEVTAIEIEPKIAMTYQEFYPDDQVIICDAHEYLLHHYEDFGFIWSSPPCPTHSDIRRCGVRKGQYPATYPDMKLYEEIIFLTHFSNCPWAVENVKSYYTPLIKPYEVERHYFWSNFVISGEKFKDDRRHNAIVGSTPCYGFDISAKNVENKRAILRNIVNPELGRYVFDCAFKQKQLLLSEMTKNTKKNEVS